LNFILFVSMLLTGNKFPGREIILIIVGSLSPLTALTG
jgi:hypothetical protein